MKRLFGSSILYLILTVVLSMVVSAVGDISVTSVGSGSVYVGANYTNNVVINNINPTNSHSIALPTSVTLAGVTTQAVNVYYNTSSPIIIPPSSSVTLQYKVVIPLTMTSGAYTGAINFAADASNYGILNLNLDVLGKLYIDDLDVTVEDRIKDEDETSKNIDDGDKISAEVMPGSTVTFDFKIGNAFTDDEDIEIRDIVITVTIDDIDDGDEMEEESDEFDINADDKSDRVEIEFDMPLDLEEGDYTVTILVEGEDDNDVDHEVEWELELEVQKESHFIYLRDYDVSPSTVGCDRTASLNVELMNLGSRDEDEVVVEIKSSSLGIDISEEDIEIEEDIDDNTYENTYTLEVDSSVPAGLYTLVLKAYSQPGKLTDAQSLEFNVEDCAGGQTSQTQTTIPTQTTVPTYPTTTQPTQGQTIINPPIITQPEQSSVEVSFMDSAWYVVLLVLINVAGIGVLIFLVIKTIQKRQEQ
jgi:hypothetical protein